jgi:predicted DsbA family dithiol-disulfide isomerase
VKWTAFPLHPDTPEAGLTLEEMFEKDACKIPKMKGRWGQAAEKAGLPFSDRTHTYNSRLAQELGKWAETRGSGNKFHAAVYRAYFVDGKNIAKIDVLMKLTESLGLSVDQAKTVLQTHTFSQAVDADWTRSAEMAIELVPTCVFNGKPLENPQEYDLLAQFLIENNVSRRNAVS